MVDASGYKYSEKDAKPTKIKLKKAAKSAKAKKAAAGRSLLDTLGYRSSGRDGRG